MLSLLLLGLFSGQPPESSQTQQDEGFRIGVAVNQVFLSVNARSVAGGFVSGLIQEDLQVYENGVKQEILNFYSEGVPVNVVLLIDISGSTREAQGEIQRAALGFASSLSDEDRVAIITFNDAPRLILNWTNDIEKVELALGSIYAKGSTVFNDALYVTFDDLLAKVEGKKAVIALTDGIDTNSMVEPEETMNLAVRSEAMVYVVSKLEEYWAGAIAARIAFQSRGQLVPRVLKDPFILSAKRFLERLEYQISFGHRVLWDLPCHCLSCCSLWNGSSRLAAGPRPQANPSHQPVVDCLLCRSAPRNDFRMAEVGMVAFFTAVVSSDFLLVGLPMGRAHSPFILSSRRVL